MLLFQKTDYPAKAFPDMQCSSRRYSGIIICLVALFAAVNAYSQKKLNDMKDGDTPLHLVQPDYPTPYGKTSPEDIKEVLNRIYSYLNRTTPAKLVSKSSGKEIANVAEPGSDAVFQAGDFRLLSYEWGVTYAGMLAAGSATGDKRFTDYTDQRLTFIAQIVPYYKVLLARTPDAVTPVNSVIDPKALDDAGALCAAMIKLMAEGTKANLKPVINNFIDYISHRQYRLPDGTLARNRPLPNTLWLDDLFMSVPALAGMGKFSGEKSYYDDAIKQVLAFRDRMFDREKGLFIHGWVQEMRSHPKFYWGRANGWALMAITELLSVLPEHYPGRDSVLQLLRAHIAGIAAYQSDRGLWHQLLDRNDAYLETSASAIFTYCIAKAINQGWIDKTAYGPVALLAWNAVASKVNAGGQVEGTCVGTGMGFDPEFYYHRPVSKYAAHGYGPVLLAGSEMIRLLRNNKYSINDGAVQFDR